MLLVSLISSYPRIRTPALASILFLSISLCALPAPSRNLFPLQGAQAPALSKVEFEIIEGRFHDGLGTYAEVALANELITCARLPQPPFDASSSRAKMAAAIDSLPGPHQSRIAFKEELINIDAAAKKGAVELLERAGAAKLTRVRHTPREYAGARAGDLRLEFAGRADMPVSVKTDKSGKVAVAEGQTPNIGTKWAERYFKVTQAELDLMLREIGFSSMAELKSDYLNVARLVAHVIIHKLRLSQCQPTDFSRARVGDLDAVKYLLRRLLHFKHGNDESSVIIFDRSTGEVKWESLLDGVNIDRLTADRISFLPSHPRSGRSIASEFGIKIDGRTVVTFQVKHRRGPSRATAHQYEFSDITTRLRI
jgi:hypothetical protein